MVARILGGVTLHVAGEAIRLESGHAIFGPEVEPAAELFTDTETFVRLCGGRRPDPQR